MKANAGTYLEFLRIILREIVLSDCLRKNDFDSIEEKNRLSCHLFSFTQVVYAIKERLKNEYPEKEKEIELFFETEVMKHIANEWKHESSMEFRQEWETKELGAKRIVPIGERSIEVSTIKLVNPKVKLPKEHSLNKDDKDLVEMCKECYEKIIAFFDKNQFPK